MLNEIRIIGGKFKSKKISVINATGLRPTASRVRETLFNWLMHDIRNSACLDLFAGSGALGIEAYSRYAKNVTFVEKNKACFEALKKTINTFEHTGCNLINADAKIFLTDTKQTFDIIFFDPPFSDPNLYDLIQIIVSRKLLNSNGLLYVESPKSLQNNMTDNWHLIKEKKTQQAFYALYQRSIQ
jgi:16S rRNA (guanine966-N2)-methyltransferase